MADISFSGGSVSNIVSTNITQVSGTAVSSGGISNAAGTSGMLNVLSALRYNTAAPTLTNGQYNTLQGDVNGNLLVTLSTLIAGEDQVNNVMKTEQQFSYTTISTATTTTVKSGTGFLHRIIVTGGTTGTIVVYDNTAGSGTKILDYDTTNALASYEINAKFSTGLTIVTSAATKITIIYR